MFDKSRVLIICKIIQKNETFEESSSKSRGVFRTQVFCMTSLSVTSSALKTSMIFWGTSFKFWLRLCDKYFFIYIKVGAANVLLKLNYL